VEQEEQHLSKGQRHHQEEKAARAQRQRPDRQRHQPRGEHRRGQGEKDRAAHIGRRDEIDGVGGKAVERGVAETHEPGAADQQL
jgi:hypothetical protein